MIDARNDGVQLHTVRIGALPGEDRATAGESDSKHDVPAKTLTNYVIAVTEERTRVTREAGRRHVWENFL
jgi:hypothetical protein